ncbi:Cas1p-domain-containing protein [Abortiporus biennis]|nr:Cas1p-domain-containing protein [Abortiporus biennis]
MSLKRPSFSLNPAWTHYLAAFTLTGALLLGLFRLLVLDQSDPIHCDALSNRGKWLDKKFKNWQSDGCMMYNYQPKDITSCLETRSVVFIGDSVTRQLFFQFAHMADSSLPTSPPDDEHKHVDYTLESKNGLQISFYWDPFLTGDDTKRYISGSAGNGTLDRPSLLVIGSGLWYLRYATDSGGLPAWESKMETILQGLSTYEVADRVVILPVEDVVPSKLSKDRAESMRASDIDAMNSDLYHRLRPLSANTEFSIFGPSKPNNRFIDLPLVFNKMLEPSQTEDGLHFSDALVKVQANVLLNLRCNDVLPKTFPLDKTCCSSYPWPSAAHIIALGGVILWGPISWFLARRLAGSTGFSWPSKEQMPPLTISVSIALIYLADRSNLWLKEQKQFDPWAFGFLSLFTLAVGLLTSKRADNDLGFLNRDQTDEWKGWMQLAILIYHYLGASKISGIYNPIRVLVASYLFMTGYGHTTFYIKKADFGFLRVAQIMVRLNFYTLVLAYTMNTDYISYYFSPLVSMWYLIIYGTMLAGSRYNDRTVFVVAKIFISMGLMTWFMSEPWLLEGAFGFLERIFRIHWSAREWAFRVNLDLWIVYFGMLCAIVVIKIRENRLTDHTFVPLIAKGTIVVSGFVLFWFFAFELSQPDKFTYNAWHPYISFLPVGAFVVLRNANGILRSVSSRMFAFIGKCSLETFIIQYHFWLAGDTKGILLVIPGTRWRPLNMVITTIMFIYVSDRVSDATGQITKWICAISSPPTLPTSAAPTATRSSPQSTSEAQEIIFLVPQEDGSGERKDNEGNDLPPEPDTPVRSSRRWVDRLAEGSSSASSPSGFRVWYGETEWNPGVKTKIGIALGVMWLLNLLWTYP